jgi:hypothetical protein
LTFESVSTLTRIEASAVTCCSSLRRICIPASVEILCKWFMCKSCFFMWIWIEKSLHRNPRLPPLFKIDIICYSFLTWSVNWCCLGADFCE